MEKSKEILNTIRTITADEEFHSVVDDVEVALGQTDTGGFYIDTHYVDGKGNTHIVSADLKPDLTLHTVLKSLNREDFKPMEITNEIRHEFHDMILKLIRISEMREAQES
jgi:hypothetical protein